MANSTSIDIKNRIAEFVDELDALVRRSTLEALKSVLENGGVGPVPLRRGRPAGAKRGPGRPRGRRPADLGDASEKIVAHVRANDGQGIGAIADATGVDLKTAKKAAIQLLASGALKKSGQKRGTVYHIGSGRPARATKARKAGKRRGRKAAKAARKPQAKPKRAVRRVKANRRVVVTPVRRRAVPAAKPVEGTDVPEALAVTT